MHFLNQQVTTFIFSLGNIRFPFMWRARDEVKENEPYMNDSIRREHNEFQCTLDLSLPFPIFKIQDENGEVIFKSSQYVTRARKDRILELLL